MVGRVLPTPPADPATHYGLTTGTLIVDRGAEGVQIGTDPPRSFLLTDPPAGWVRVLAGLDGTAPLGQVLHSVGADPQVWLGVIAGLIEVGLVGPAPARRPPARFAAERAALGHRYGPTAADRMLAARADSTVVVIGSTRLAVELAGLLAGSGVGHVHHRPHRALLASDLPPGTPTPLSAGRAPRRSRPGGARATAADVEVLAELLRHREPTVRTDRPAGQIHPELHIIAVDGPADPADVTPLARSGLAHLQVWAGPARAVVGPLVLPGRSSCLRCAELHRADADRFAPTVARARRTSRLAAPLYLVAAALGGAGRQALQYLDGTGRPDAVDATVEWDTDGRVRRRSWPAHPECGCGAMPDTRDRPHGRDRGTLTQ